MTGFENEIDKPFDYSGSFSYGISKLYGIVNDPEIVRIELHLDGEKFLSQEIFYEDLFYFTWTNRDWGNETLIGYNKDGKIVYKTENP